MKRYGKRIGAWLATLCLLLGITTPASAMQVAQSDLQTTIEAYAAEHEATTAAMSVSVFDESGVLYMGRFGSIDKENGIKNDADSVFEWGSCTKLLVWVSVMQLAEQGLIDLDADIRTYLPDAFLTKLKYETPITMLNLMNHNAGWQEQPVELFTEEGRSAASLEESLKNSEPAQIFKPGTYVAYSNFGAALAGFIVERVSGKLFYQYVQENIFSPLGMTHTALNAGLSDNEWVQAARRKLAFYAPDGTHLPYPLLNVPLYPAGMATGTIEDMCIFAQALAAKPGDADYLFSKAETHEIFFTPTLVFPDGVSAENCHGMWAMPFGGQTYYGHGGNTAGCSAQIYVQPETGEGMVVMTNQSGEGVYCTGLYERIFGSMEEGFAGASGQTPNVQGVYLRARTVREGMLKLYSITGLMPLMQHEDGSAYVPLANQIECKAIAPNAYLLDLGGMRMPLYTEVVNGKVERFSMMTMDYFRISGAEAGLMVVMLAAFIVCGLYGFVMLIIQLIRLFLKRQQPFGGPRALANGAMFLCLCSVVLLAVGLSMFIETRAQVTMQGILFILFAVILAGFVVAVLRKRRKLEKKQRRGLTVNAVMGLIMLANIFYWQLWMFWV